MDLATIEPALLAWAAAVTGVEASCVVWENAPRVQYNTHLVTLSWVSSREVGTDETVWAYDAAAESALTEMTPTVRGQRAAVLQLSVEGYDHTAGTTARAILERARTRLQWPSSLAALRAVGLAWAGAGSVVAADYRGANDRWVSRALLDVNLNANASEADLAGRTSALTSVDVTADLQTPAGDSLADSIQPGGILP